jgi:hypothetical protein
MPLPKTLRKFGLILLVANAVGAVIYVLAARNSWAIPQESGLHATTGEPFVWALYVLPIWIFFSLVDLIWVSTIAVHRSWKDGRIWAAAIFIWIIAVVIDFSHH